MPAVTCPRWIWPLVVLTAAVHASARAADRFVANLADGQRVSTSRFTMWPVPGAPSRWGDQDLLASDNPVRLLRDRQASVDLRPPFLVLANGDVLTGTAVALDDDSGREDAAPRIKVQLEGILPVSGTGISVRTDRILRIVGSAEASLRQEPPPGTVELADGRRLVARSIKWREYGLALLTADGVVEANYAEIVDAVFPGIDRTAAVLDDNLWAGDTSRGTIVRFQLAGGAIITASRISREQERSRRRNRSGVEVATYYYAQPAWADQPLALPEVEIAWCGYRAANQAPLSLLPAELVASRRFVGTGAAWQRGAAGGDQLPACGEIESDVAIRTQAHSEIAFDLPAGAKTLSTVVGLDRAVGSGGCVRCLIIAEKPDGRMLWDSGVIVGGDGPRPTGPLDVSGLARVVLMTQAAHDERPPGADPLDIRDEVSWLAPLVEIDLVHTHRLPVVLAGLAPWELAGDGLEAAQITSEWNPRQQSWDPVLTLPKDQPLVLTRTVRVTHAGDVLDLRTACPDELDEHMLELTVNGRPLNYATSVDRAEQRKRLHSYGRQRLRDEDETAAVTDRLAYWWDLQPWRGQDVQLVLSLSGKRERNEIAWRGLAVRSAIVNLPQSGRPLRFDVALAAVKPQSVKSSRTAPAIGRLPGSPREDRSIRFLGQAYSGGYGMMRDSTITFPLAPEYKRFVAIAGCTHQVAGPMRVLIDGQVAWERSLMLGLAQAEQIDLAIPAGAKTLTLVLGKDGSPYGYAAFAEAGFVTE